VIDSQKSRDWYRNLKGRLNAREVLDYYHAENVSEVASSDGTTELIHSCLLDRVEPHHAHGDAHPSASVNIEKGVYVCYNYWGGSLLHLVAKMEGTDIGGAMPVLSNMLDGAVKDADTFRDMIALRFSKDPVYDVELPSYSERVLDPWLVCHPYLYDERRISPEAMGTLRLGYDERENRIVFPHFWKGNLVGWQKRAIPAREGWPGTEPPLPKYRNSTGFPKSETLYGYDLAARVPGPVTVVESPMSVARALTHRIPGVVATFGAKVTDTQIDLLADFDRVTVWFDADAAGTLGRRKLVEGLYRRTRVMVVEPDEGKDLADYDTADEVVQRIESAEHAVLWRNR
jgi:hypothetical protein